MVRFPAADSCNRFDSHALSGLLSSNESDCRNFDFAKELLSGFIPGSGDTIFERCATARRKPMPISRGDSGSS